ncbi:MAG: hypothetical protein MRZ91_06905 [Christensenellaceae bacterium]|nr:hypothetical protein [Christensenellaceae bacterium]MDD6927423.1 hypothetical protein [bacterium]MDY2850771.1 hypothetical protein [Christensenellaceae bacterium]
MSAFVNYSEVDIFLILFKTSIQRETTAEQKTLPYKNKEVFIWITENSAT